MIDLTGKYNPKLDLPQGGLIPTWRNNRLSPCDKLAFSPETDSLLAAAWDAFGGEVASLTARARAANADLRLLEYLAPLGELPAHPIDRATVFRFARQLELARLCVQSVRAGWGGFNDARFSNAINQGHRIVAHCDDWRIFKHGVDGTPPITAPQRANISKRLKTAHLVFGTEIGRAVLHPDVIEYFYIPPPFDLSEHDFRLPSWVIADLVLSFRNVKTCLAAHAADYGFRFTKLQSEVTRLLALLTETNLR